MFGQGLDVAVQVPCPATGTVIFSLSADGVKAETGWRHRRNLLHYPRLRQRLP